jgi:hypothetical protein
MRKKLIALAFALGAGWYALSAPTPAAAGQCNGFQVCCPDGPCYCCIRPCSPQCP